jgi:PLD-like domain
MNFKLVEAKWAQEFEQAVNRKPAGARLRVICPFIKEEAARRLLRNGGYRQIEVITRFDPNCFRDHVSDTAALRNLLQAGATIKGVKNLHAKVYLIGKRAIVTSANLTEQALNRNHEFGFWSDDPGVMAGCNAYFEGLWRRAGNSVLRESKLDEWDRIIAASLGPNGGTQAPARLKDEGTDVGLPPDSFEPPRAAKFIEQAFVKFFGKGDNRAHPAMRVLEEVNSSTSHWALSYPAAKTPRSVKKGALMFIGRLSQGDDILIYGRAIAEAAYRPGVDDATKGDIKKRTWKERWSRYIRVQNGEFINGTLADGVSLNSLMQALGPLSFATTKSRHARGERNIRVRGAYARQAQVQLTPEAIAWLNEEMDRRFELFGRISEDALDDLIHPAP